MKGKNARKILKLFDYFKEAFRLNINNKQLYKPQIIFLILRGVLVFMAGLSLADISRTMMPFIGDVTFRKFFALMWGEFQGTPLLLMLTSFIVAAFGSTYVEAGLYAMYAKISSGQEENPVFASGANRYFLPFLGGNILIFLFWIVAALPYVIVGALTLTLGFIWVPTIISAMLMVWKASLVSDEVGVFEAIGRSFSFGKRHFWPAIFFVIIRSAVTQMSGGGGSGNSGGNYQGNFNGGGSMENMPFNEGFNGDFSPPDFGDGGNLVYWIVLVIFALFAAISVLAGLIEMIFDIFFGITAVILYQDDWHIEEIIEETDELVETDAVETDAPGDEFEVPETIKTDNEEEVE